MSTDTNAPVQFVSFADAGSRLVCGYTDGEIRLYNGYQDTSPKLLASPMPGAQLIELLPNPGDRSELCLLVYASQGATDAGGTCHILDVRTGNWLAQLPEAGVTSAAWSTKGKQLVAGLRSGEMVQMTPEGDVKARMGPPPEADRSLFVKDVRWLENHVFLTTYNTISDEPVHEYDVFVVLRDPKTQACTYAAFPLDVAPPFGDVEREGKRYAATLRAWSKEKHLVFLASAPSTDVGVLGCQTDVSGPSAWNALELEDTSRPVLPFSSVDESSDTSPVGLAFDLTATEPVEDPNAAAKGEDPSTTLPATPILLVYTSDGVLLAYNVINTQATEPYPGMVRCVTGQDAPDASERPSAGATAFGSPTPAFGATSTPSAAPAFGATSTPNSTPAYGAPSKPGVTAPAFGATSTPGSTAFSKPTFGQTSSTGGFSAFGGGNAAFGTMGSAFGSNSAKSEKAVPAFGSTAPSAFGGTSTPSAFGQPTFGQSSAFGSQVSRPSAFGGFSSESTLGGSSQPAFGQASAFGNPSTFGRPTSSNGQTGSAFSTMSEKSSGFGAVSSSNNGSVFGSGGTFDKGKPAFAGATPAPKPVPGSNLEAEMHEEPSDDAFSFGSLNDIVSGKPSENASKSNTLANQSQTTAFGSDTTSQKPSAGFAFGQPRDDNPKGTSAFSFAKANETSSNAPQSSSAIEADTQKTYAAQSASPFSFAKADKPDKGQSSENKAKQSELPDTKSEEEADDVKASKSPFSFSFSKSSEDKEVSLSTSGQTQKLGTEESQDASASGKDNAAAKAEEDNRKSLSTGLDSQSSQNMQNADKLLAEKEGETNTVMQMDSKSAESKAEKDLKSKEDTPDPSAFSSSKENHGYKPGQENLASTLSFFKPKEEKPTFSLAGMDSKPRGEKPETPAFSFAKPDDKSKGEKSAAPSFSFASANDKLKNEKPAAPAFSFAKSNEQPTAPTFSFAKPDDSPKDKKPEAPAFSFAKPDDKPKDEKPTAPVFSFAKPDAKTKDEKATAAFSFVKPDAKTKDEKSVAPAFSLAKPNDNAKETLDKPAFSFARPDNKSNDQKSAQSAFSLPNPEDKPKDEKPAVPTFSFSKPNEKPRDAMFSAPPFSFTKPDDKPKDEKPAAPALAFAEPHEKPKDGKPVASAFSLAQPDKQPPSPAFSFVKQEKPQASSPELSPSRSILLRDIKVPSIHQPSPSTPSVSEDGELQREFVKIYLSLNAELETLQEGATETASFYRSLQSASGQKQVGDLESETWTFGDLQTLPIMARQLHASIEKADHDIVEHQQRVASIQSIQLKAEIKRDETARFLRARKDPSFAKRVHVRHLGPEHVENQQRLRRTTHVVRERMHELDDYLASIKTSLANERTGRSPLHAPSLDSVYRSAEHISCLAARRLAELDKLGLELREFYPQAARPMMRAEHVPWTTPRKTSSTLDSLDALHATLPEPVEDNHEEEQAAHRAAMESVLQARPAPLITQAPLHTTRPQGDAPMPVQEPLSLRSARMRDAWAPKAAPKEEAAPVHQESVPQPSRGDFLATKTPSGVQTSQPSPAISPLTFVSSLTSNKQALQPQGASQYTTFEGLVPPRRASPPSQLTLDEFVEQDDGYGDEDYDDYGEDEDDEDDYEEEEEEDRIDDVD